MNAWARRFAPLLALRAVPSPGGAAGPKKARTGAWPVLALSKVCGSVLLADLHARPDPSIAIPNRLTVRPIALRRSDQSRHEQRQHAKHAATAATTVVPTMMMVMMVVVMMVILRDLNRARRVLADP